MFINCLWFNEQAWETVFKPFTMKICEVIWIFKMIFERQGPEKGTFLFLLSLAVQQHSPSNLTELERICIEKWENLPKYRWAKPVASYPRRLKAVIAARGAATKCSVQGLNTYVNVIFLFIKHFNKKKLFLLCY